MADVQIDDGIIKLRQMYLREIDKVKRGEDPRCIVRDPEKNRMIVIPAYDVAPFVEETGVL